MRRPAKPAVACRLERRVRERARHTRQFSLSYRATSYSKAVKNGVVGGLNVKEATIA